MPVYQAAKKTGSCPATGTTWDISPLPERLGLKNAPGRRFTTGGRLSAQLLLTLQLPSLPTRNSKALVEKLPEFSSALPTRPIR